MFGFIPASEQAIRERAKNAALAEVTSKNAANVDYIAMMCDIDLDGDADTITDEISPGEHFYANDTEYVFKGVTKSGDIIAAEAHNDNSEEGEDNE